MAPPETQTAIVQTRNTSPGNLPLRINHSAPIPTVKSEYDVLVRVLAVALNPNDHKMVIHFNNPGSIAGCDFCGIVVDTGGEASSSSFPAGARVCGALFPYGPETPDNGSFAQFLVADARLLIQVPDSWTDLAAASLGVAWSTISLAFSDPSALNLQGLPTKPAHQSQEPVLVYGGGTASGTFACQLLKLMNYTPIAVASNRSADLAVRYGAAAIVSYLSKDCADQVKEAAGTPIRRILDCITDAESVAICFSAMARTGGRYACLEECPLAWRTRRAVKVKEVMGFEVLGIDMNLGDSIYRRAGDQKLMDIGIQWAGEIQVLMESLQIKAHPLRELSGGWDAIIEGLDMLRKSEVRGQKLVVRLPQD